MKLTDIAEASAELMTAISVQLPARLLTMRGEMNGQPRAARYDHDGQSTYMWCWTHEREVRACHRDDLDCTGESFDIHDITGEAAVSHDPASNHHRELGRLLASTYKNLDRITRIMASYPLPDERRVDIVRAGIGSCYDCRHYMDGTRGNRLSSYKGGDPVCSSCRARRDRKVSA